MNEYILILIIFIFAMALSLATTIKTKRHIKTEVQKSEILIELINLRMDYKIIADDKRMKNLPEISDSLRDIDNLVNRLGFKVELGNVFVAPASRDSNYIEKLIKTLNEIKTAPEDIKDVFLRKVDLVNKIAMTKHPTFYLYNKIVSRAQWSLILYLIGFVMKSIKLLDCINRKFGREKKKYIVNPYPIICKTNC